MSIGFYTIPANKIVHYTQVDISSWHCIVGPIHVVQYDNKIPIVAVKLRNNGASYIIDASSMEAWIRWKKPDGTFVRKQALGCDATQNTLYFEITQQMVMHYGTVKPVVELVIPAVSNGEPSVACSSSFSVIIDKNPIQNGDIESTTVYEDPYKNVVYTKNEIDVKFADINKSLLNCEKVYSLGAVTSASSLISYKEKGTVYTGTIAYQADYSGDFLMFIINSCRYLLTSDGHLWRFNSLISTTPTKLTYTADEVESILDDYDEAVVLKLNLKADKATTLAGYGINDAYTKTESDSLLANKLDNTAGSVATDNIASKAVTSEKIANGAVTVDKLSEDVTNQFSKLKGDLDNKTFLYKHVTHDNLWDSTKSTKGLAVNCKNGEFTCVNCYTSDFIPVEAGKSYFMGKANGEMMEIDKPSVGSYALFDKDKNFVPQPIPTNVGAWNPIPDGVSYIRFTVFYSTNNTSCMVKEGIDAPTKFVSYADGTHIEAGWKDAVLQNAVEKSAMKYAEENISIDGNRIAEKSVSAGRFDFVTEYNLNLNNPDTVMPNTIIRNTGNTVEYSYYDTTDFIPVKAGNTYYPSAFGTYALYDENKKFIENSFNSISGNIPITGITSKQNGYIRFSFLTGSRFALSEYACSDFHDYGSKYVHADSYMKDSFTSDNNVKAMVSKWNLVDKNKIFHANMNINSGVITILDSKGDQFAIISGIEQCEYILIRKANPTKIFEYDENWNYIGMVNSSIHGNDHYTTYTPSTNAKNILALMCNFIARSDTVRNEYINVLYRINALKTDSAQYELTQFFLDSIKDGFRERLVEIILKNSEDSIQQTINHTQGLKWNCLGDSLTTMGWGGNMYSMVAKRLGITPTNYGIVSSTIADYSGDGTSGNPMCVRYATMTNDADIVTVMGCTNDARSKIGTFDDTDGTTLYGACHILFKGLIEKYPNAKIGVILPPQNGQGIPHYVETQGGDPKMASMRAKVAVVKEVAEYYSLPVLDLFHHGGISGMVADNIGTLIQGDYLHLTTEGYRVLAPKLQTFIEQLCKPY